MLTNVNKWNPIVQYYQKHYNSEGTRMETVKIPHNRDAEILSEVKIVA